MVFGCRFVWVSLCGGLGFVGAVYGLHARLRMGVETVVERLSMPPWGCGLGVLEAGFRLSCLVFEASSFCVSGF